MKAVLLFVANNREKVAIYLDGTYIHATSLWFSLYMYIHMCVHIYIYMDISHIFACSILFKYKSPSVYIAYRHIICYILNNGQAFTHHKLKRITEM